MLRKCNKILSFLLALALVITTFGSDFANAKVFAVEEENIVEETTDNTEDVIDMDGPVVFEPTGDIPADALVSPALTSSVSGENVNETSDEVQQNESGIEIEESADDADDDQKQDENDAQEAGDGEQPVTNNGALLRASAPAAATADDQTDGEDDSIGMYGFTAYYYAVDADGVKCIATDYVEFEEGPYYQYSLRPFDKLKFKDASTYYDLEAFNDNGLSFKGWKNEAGEFVEEPVEVFSGVSPSFYAYFEKDDSEDNGDDETPETPEKNIVVYHKNLNEVETESDIKVVPIGEFFSNATFKPFTTETYTDVFGPIEDESKQFLGWTVAASGFELTEEENSFTVEKDKKYDLYARWADLDSVNVEYYGVYFNKGEIEKVDETAIYEESFSKDDVLTIASLDKIGEVEGYEIEGFYTSSDCNEETKVEPGSQTEATAIYVKFVKVNTAKYTVEFYKGTKIVEEDTDTTGTGVVGEEVVIGIDYNKYKDDNYGYKETKYYSREDGVDTELTGVDKNKILEDDKLVVKVFYTKHTTPDDVYFFIISNAKHSPDGWEQSPSFYMPEGGNTSGLLWKGSATNINDLIMVADDLKEQGKCNYYEKKGEKYFAFYNWNNGIQALSNYQLTDDIKGKIDESVAEYTLTTDAPADEKFTEDDVLWYVYKRQNSGPNHIDGYISSYITYYPGYPTDQQPYQGARVRFGESATVLNNTFTREGYVFNGWKEVGKENKYAEGETIGMLTSKLKLEATWKPLNSSYTVEYYYQKKDGSFNTTADEVTGPIPVTLAPGENWPKTVKVTPEKNVKYKFVNYTYIAADPRNKVSGKVTGDDYSLILKVYYFRNKLGKQLIIKAKSDVKEYDGTPLVNSGYDVYDTQGNTVEGITATVEGSQEIVGTSDNIITAITYDGVTYPVNRRDGTVEVDQDEYDKITIIDGTLEVTPIKIIVTAKDDEKIYGDADPTFTATAKRAVKDADGNISYVDFSMSKVAELAIFDIARENGEDVRLDAAGNITTYQIRFENVSILDNNYDIEFVPAKFTINPRPVTLRSGDKLDQEFTGKPISYEYVYVKEGSFVGEENVNVKMSPEAYVIKPGESKDNLYEVTSPVGNTKLTNYVITTEYGRLSIRPLNGDDKIKIIVSVEAGPDGTDRKVEYYNGQVQTLNVVITINGNVYSTTRVVEGETAEIDNFAETIRNFVESLREFFVIKAFAAEGREISTTFTINGVTFTLSGINVYGGEGIDVDVYPVTLDTTGMKVVVNDIEVTDSFEVELAGATPTSTPGREQIGELEIIPRPVVLTSESASKQYDGTPLTRPNVAVSGMGFIEGEVNEIKANGSITDPGSVTNNITYVKLQNYKDRNYVVTVEEGTLTVTGGGDNPPSDPTPPPTEPTPPSVTPPAGQVLGAVREVPSGDGAAVLGARRGRTEDTTNTLGRIITIIVAAGIGFMMIFIKRKKNEE